MNSGFSRLIRCEGYDAVVCEGAVQPMTPEPEPESTELELGEGPLELGENTAAENHLNSLPDSEKLELRDELPLA